MNEKNTKYLFEKYPKLYAQKDLPRTESLMCYGFPGDGWFELIDELSFDIQNLCDQKGFQVEAVQVKSKWGGLRFYITSTDECDVDNSDYEILRKLISAAESKSFNICQRCSNEIKESDRRSLRNNFCSECKRNI
jgi:hypothetical protein